MPKYVASVGLATEKDYWDLDHPSLSQLKEFLLQANG